MIYTTRLNHTDEGQQFRDNHQGVWAYITPQQYRTLSPEQKRICGDMRRQDSASMERVLQDGDYRLGLYEYHPGVRWKEKVVGYIPVSQEGEEEPTCCVRVLETSYFKMFLYPLFALLLLASVVVGILLVTQQNTVPGLDKTAVAYRIEGMSNTDPDQIMMPYLSEMQLGQGETHLRELLINPEGNECYFKFQFTLDDTGEVLYESGLVEPGKAIIDFDLNRTLDVGEHQVTVKILTSDLNDPTKSLNGGDMKIIIRVVE